MSRLLTGIAGALLLAAPAWMLLGMTVPVPRFRTGTMADYATLLRSCVVIYGGAALGIVVQRLRGAGRSRAMTGVDVFRACLAGGIAATAAAIAVAGGGNLWGLVVIFGAGFSAVVGAGGGLLWRAFGRPNG